MKNVSLRCFILLIPFLFILGLAQSSLLVLFQFVWAHDLKSSIAGFIFHMGSFLLLMILYEYITRDIRLASILRVVFLLDLILYSLCLVFELMQSDWYSAWDSISRFIVIYAILMIFKNDHTQEEKK